MDIRVSSRIVTLNAPFRLASHPFELAAGVYTLIERDEVITGDTFSASRRLSTVMIPPGPPSLTLTGQGHLTFPWEIARLLKADAVAGQANMNDQPEPA